MARRRYLGKLSNRAKLFCKYVAEGDNQSTAAIKAGYSRRGNRSRACRLMKREEIRAEIRKLQEDLANPRIASIFERKKLLTDIARARISDYFEVVNEEIRWKEGADKEKAGGLFKIKSVIKTDKSGNTTRTMSVQLGNVIKAIAELNKMDGLYNKVNDSQLPKRKFHIIVEGKGKYLTEGKSDNNK